MSKESRRAARLARESRRLGDPSRQGASPDGPPDGTPVGSPDRGATRSTRPAGRPTSGVGARAGRRERTRFGPEPTFFQRYRSAIVTVAAIAIAAIAVGYVFIASTSASYTCTSQFNPSPTPSASPGSSARLGFFETDMGNSHEVSVPQNYLLCPPASGNHFNVQGQGPIAARVYRPDDKVGPQNWVHNLEHGGMVVLYRNDSPGATTAGQQAFKDYAAAFPPSAICKVPPLQLSPVIARFDNMPHAYAALVWDRVLYFDTWDPDLVTRFYLTEGERVDTAGELIAPPEDTTGCKARLASSSPAASSAPSDAPSTAPSAGSSAPAASSAPSATAAPSASAAPSAAPS